MEDTIDVAMPFVQLVEAVQPRMTCHDWSAPEKKSTRRAEKEVMSSL